MIPDVADERTEPQLIDMDLVWSDRANTRIQASDTYPRLRTFHQTAFPTYLS
jgi:hypothetical protein